MLIIILTLLGVVELFHVASEVAFADILAITKEKGEHHKGNNSSNPIFNNFFKLLHYFILNLFNNIMKINLGNGAIFLWNPGILQNAIDKAFKEVCDIHASLSL